MNTNSVLIIIFSLFANIAVGQSDEVNKLFEPTETDSLYILSIENYIKELNANNDKEILSGPNSKIIYVQYQNYLARIPKTINGYSIIQLGLANRKKYFRKNKNRLSLVEISPLNLKDGLFNITLIPYGAKLKGKRKLNLSYSHFTKTYFKYVDGKLVMDKTESGGI